MDMTLPITAQFDVTMMRAKNAPEMFNPKGFHGQSIQPQDKASAILQHALHGQDKAANNDGSFNDHMRSMMQELSQEQNNAKNKKTGTEIAQQNTKDQPKADQADIRETGGLKKLSHEEQLDRAAQEFEAVFLSQLLKPMFETVEVDPMFGGGHGEEMFRGMIVEEYGKELAERGGIGLKDHIKEQLKAYAAHK
jgi:flagellar hook-basal body complex protein FliE